MKRPVHNLEALLGGPARIGVLRVLAGADSPLTGRQVAAAAGLSHAGATRFLGQLRDDGIVIGTPVGTAVLHRFDSSHPVVRELILPLFEAETVVLPSASAEPTASEINPRIQPYLPAIEQACRRHHVISSAVFGSATQTTADVTPNDLDLLVTFEPLEPKLKAEAYAALVAELESIMGMPVDVMVSTAIKNPYLAQEIERTKVALYEVA